MAVTQNHSRPKRRGFRWGAALGVLVFIGIGGALAVASSTYDRIGRTPVELLDYIERRLEGHNKLEWLAAPALNLLRDSLDAPRLAERTRRFAIPPPPRRRGVDAALAPRVRQLQT
jgi:hypothetical protein